MAYELTNKDALTISAATVQGNGICWIDATHFISAYALTSAADSYIKTFSVDGSYQITEIDSLMHDGVLNPAYGQRLIKVDATHFALTYTQSDNDGILKIFSIDGSYQITQDWELIYNTTLGGYSAICMLDSSHIAIDYLATGNDGQVSIIELASGTLAPSVITTLVHETSSHSGNCSICKIDNTHFAVTYYNSLATDGYIKTFSVDGSYNITQVYSLAYDTTNGQDPAILLLDPTHLVVAYSGGAADGFIKVFSIDGSYNVANITTLEHDTSYGLYNSVVKIDATHIALFYQSISSDIIKIIGFDGSYNPSVIQSLAITGAGDRTGIDLLGNYLAVINTGTSSYAQVVVVEVAIPVVNTFKPYNIIF